MVPVKPALITLSVKDSTSVNPYRVLFMTESNTLYPVSGAGLGLRREKLDEMLAMMQTGDLSPVDFMEVAPENWINLGGSFGKKLRQFTEKYDFVCHGLSLSIGSPAPLDEDFVKDIGQFMQTHQVKHYSEHLTPSLRFIAYPVY